MPRTSKYVIFVDNISSNTRTKDLEYEFGACGKIKDIIKDSKFSSKDADYAWRKMDGFKMDSRKWKVDYATMDDFKFFGWKWFEHTPSPRRSRSRSRSASPARSRSRSQSPQTPYNKEDKGRDASCSPSPKAGRSE